MALGAGLPVINIPAAAQPDNRRGLNVLVFPTSRGWRRARPRRHAAEVVVRAHGPGRVNLGLGFVEEGNFATEYGLRPPLSRQVGCKGPVVKCNVPVRGWVNGIGGCPNVGRHLHGLHDAGFPDKYMPFSWIGSVGERRCQLERFSYGPILNYFRKRNIKNKYDIEPEWRRRGSSLTSGYQPRW